MRKRKRGIKSGFEERVKQMFKDNAVLAAYEQDKLDYMVPARYIPDFTIKTDTKVIYIETKGYFDPDSRKKMKHVKKCNPNLDVRIWFQKDGYLTKRKNKKYSDWAKQHGYKYHVGESFPTHWFEGKEK